MVPADDARGAWELVAASPSVMAEARKGGVKGKRSARAYTVVAVVLAMGALLGAVSLARGIREPNLRGA
jgi:hypothetical protein